MYSMKTAADVRAIVEALKKLYPDGVCSLDYEKDYELLFSVRLAAQCTDERVNKVTPALFARFPTLEALAEADVAEVEQYIHSTGFFRAKARDIVLASQMILREYGGKVPDTMEALLKLPGVGRKTANLILGDIYHTPGVVVADTHSIRISGLLGLTDGTKDPAKVEQQLRAILPPEESNNFCHRLVLHGRAVCIARRPQCQSCTETADSCALDDLRRRYGDLGSGTDAEHQDGVGGVPHAGPAIRHIGDLFHELRRRGLSHVLRIHRRTVSAAGKEKPVVRPAAAARQPDVQPGAEHLRHRYHL